MVIMSQLRQTQNLDDSDEHKWKHNEQMNSQKGTDDRKKRTETRTSRQMDVSDYSPTCRWFAVFAVHDDSQTTDRSAEHDFH